MSISRLSTLAGIPADRARLSGSRDVHCHAETANWPEHRRESLGRSLCGAEFQSVLMHCSHSLRDEMAKAEFQFEGEMTDRVERWLLRGHDDVRREFETLWGVCDLVAVTFDREKSRKRVAEVAGATLGPLPRLALLTLARELGSVGQRSLELRCRELLGIEDAAEHLELLCALGLIAIRRGRVTARSVSWFPNHTEVVAVELKLARVEEAFYQAFNNLRFAQRSYVALPRDVAQRTVASGWHDRFAEAGIGMLSVTGSRCQVLLEGRTSRKLLDRALLAHSAERFWKARIKGSASCIAARSVRGVSPVR